jgi:peptidoglycan L-alanyl-D-glutamate endopeptidase CwlK
VVTYRLGKRSWTELHGVHPDLVSVVTRAIEITEQDFSVHDGIRTKAEQQALVDRGASKTMNSRHITGHAVDLVPYINGKLRWEWGPIYLIAAAVRQAADELGVSIRWGGCWDRLLTDSDEDPAAMVEGYVARRKSRGRSAFIDGPHFELPREEYPA